MSGQLNNTESFNIAGYQGNLFSLIWKLKAPGNWIFFGYRLFCVMFQCSISNQWCDITHSTTVWMFIPPVFCIWLVKLQEEFGEQTERKKINKERKKSSSSAPLLQKFRTSTYTTLSAPRGIKRVESENIYICIHMNKTWATVVAIWAPACQTKGVIPPSNLRAFKFRTQQGCFMTRL